MQCTISYSIYKVRPQTTFSHRKASCFIYSALILKLISYNIMASLSHFLIITVLFIVPFFSCCVNAQLSANFYARTCPTLPTIVRNAMRQAVSREGRMAASILRLFFHDCFVNVRIYITKIFSCHTTYICWLIWFTTFWFCLLIVGLWRFHTVGRHDHHRWKECIPKPELS